MTKSHQHVGSLAAILLRRLLISCAGILCVAATNRGSCHAIVSSVQRFICLPDTACKAQSKCISVVLTCRYGAPPSCKHSKLVRGTRRERVSRHHAVLHEENSLVLRDWQWWCTNQVCQPQGVRSPVGYTIASGRSASKVITGGPCSALLFLCAVDNYMLHIAGSR